MTDKKEKKQPLKSGFTTGAAAAAAAKAALWGLLTGRFPPRVGIRFLTGEKKNIPVFSAAMEKAGAVCRVIKDAGDDPDVTHKAEIGARVRILPESSPPKVRIVGGKGVGKVTKPGLEVAPGNPAINPGPIEMIQNEVGWVLRHLKKTASVEVEVFVPKGEALARKTLNPRLGILGGISILGTTGKVTPMSHAAFEATIRAALSVAGARGCKEVVFTTGRRTERFAEGLWPDLEPEAFVQMGDFVHVSLSEAARLGFGRIRLAVMFGKAVKISMAAPCTHAAKLPMNMDHLAEICRRVTQDKEFLKAMASANTARHALDMILDAHPQCVPAVGRAMLKGARVHCGPGPALFGTIFDFSGGVLFSHPKEKKDEP